MKYLLALLLLSPALFASKVFEQNIKYTCLNTYNIIQGKRITLSYDEAIKKPLKIMLHKNKLYSSADEIYEFKMKKNELISYSNEKTMLLLDINLGLGLVPKKGRGAYQYYYQCVKTRK